MSNNTKNIKISIKYCLAITILMVCSSANAYQQIFVDRDGSDTNSGLSADSPLRTFTQAVTNANYAVSNDHPDGVEIILGPGKFDETTHSKTNTSCVIWRLANNVSVTGAGSGKGTNSTQIINNIVPDGYYYYILLLEPGNNSRIQDLSIISHPQEMIKGGVICIGSFRGWLSQFPTLSEDRVCLLKNIYMESNDAGIGIAGYYPDPYSLTFNCFDMDINVGTDGVITTYRDNTRINLFNSSVKVTSWTNSIHDPRTIGLTAINSSAEIFAYNTSIWAIDDAPDNGATYADSYCVAAFDEGVVRTHNCNFYKSSATNAVQNSSHLHTDHTISAEYYTNGIIEHSLSRFFIGDTNFNIVASNIHPVVRGSNDYEVVNLYIDKAAAGNMTGVDWNNAYTDIYDALSKVETGDYTHGANLIFAGGDTHTVTNVLNLPYGVSLIGTNPTNLTTISNTTPTSWTYQFLTQSSNFTVLANLDLQTTGLGNLLIGGANTNQAATVIDNCLMSSDDTTIGYIDGYKHGSILSIFNSGIISSLNGIATYAEHLNIVSQNTYIAAEGNHPSYPGYSCGVYASHARIHFYGTSSSNSTIATANTQKNTLYPYNGPVFSDNARIYLENYHLDTSEMKDITNYTMRAVGLTGHILYRNLDFSPSITTNASSSITELVDFD